MTALHTQIAGITRGLRQKPKVPPYAYEILETPLVQFFHEESVMLRTSYSKFCLFVLFGLSATGTSVAVGAENPNAAPPESPEMKVLFNGKDLTGWDGDPRLWKVKDGVIHGETTKEEPTKGNTFLICQDLVADDFELRLSFRCSDTNNSGIQYRSKQFGDDKSGNKWRVRGYQHELRNELKLPNVAGFIYDEGGKRGRICLVGEQATWETDGKKVKSNLIDAEGFKKLFKLNEWNDVVIVAKGNNIKHYMNGTLVLDFTDNHPELALKEGILALQLHGGAPMWAEFKNIRFRATK